MDFDAEYRLVVNAKRKIAVVGAGPAGLFAAECLAEAGHSVVVVDRMAAPARKFLLAGRGGLNLTHSEPLEIFLTRYGDGAASDLVRDAVRAFPPDSTIAWANALGQETFVGTSGRVFPKAMKASPLLRAWLKRLEGLGVTSIQNASWFGFGDDGGKPELRFRRFGEELVLSPDAAIFALGGASWPKLGADGAWVAPFESANIDVTPLTPSNCGVVVHWSEVFKARFAGSPLKRISVTCNGITRRGEAMVTREGLEGGAIYALGGAIRAALAQTGSARVRLDLKPDIDAARLAEQISKPRGKDSVTNFLRKAARLDAAAIGLLREGGLPDNAAQIALHIKGVELDVTGFADIGRAISTAGGVAANAIDANWMLKANPGIFVAGEMIDFDAPTGGYLLQAAFATGRAAAAGVCHWLDDCAQEAVAAPNGALPSLK